MILFKNIGGWIDRCEECFGGAAGGSGPYRLPAPPEDLPRVDVLLCGQPGSGKSTLGNLVLGYREAPLFEGRETQAELPRFQQDMVSLARRFPDRYKGAHTIPVSLVQASTLPSLPAALGVRFTEVWGMSTGEPALGGAMMEKLLDAHPDTSLVVLVIRADQQIDAPEKQFIEQIVASPWKDSMLVLLNLRSTGHGAEEIIKLEGFVEEQCIGIGLKPRGVFALDARSGSSPVSGEVERFGDALTDVLIRLWSPRNARTIATMLLGPLGRLRAETLGRLDLEQSTHEALSASLAAARADMDRALEKQNRERQTALRGVEKLAAKAILEVEEDLEALPGSQIQTRPRETLQRFRREAIQEIEGAMGTVEDTAGWPVPDLHVRRRPGPGCALIVAAVATALATLITAITLQWPLTIVFGVITAGLVALTIFMTIKARSRWREQTMETFRSVIDEQVGEARETIEQMHSVAADPARLVPELHKRLGRLERADETVSELARLERDIEGLVAPGGAEPRTIEPGLHARTLARALAPDHPLNTFFHESGFDLDAHDLFARACEIEYSLRPLDWLQSVQTVRGWLRPPLARREKPIYPYLERLRMRWDDIGPRTRVLVERIVRKTREAGDEAAAPPRVRCTAAETGDAPPRIAIPEEALEGIMARILDEAARHAFGGSKHRPQISLAWSLDERPGEGRVAVLDVELGGARGFDSAGRQGFDSARGGLARFLADTDRGALGWCMEIEIASRDGVQTWTRKVHEEGSTFVKTGDGGGEWVTRFRLVMPAVIEEG